MFVSLSENKQEKNTETKDERLQQQILKILN